MKNIVFLVLFLVAYLPNNGISKSLNFPKKEKPVFDSIETIFQKIQKYEKLEITLNLDSLLVNRRKDKEHTAKLVLRGKDQEDLTFNTKIKPRGKYRRIRCDFPPLRLNFSKKELAQLNLYQQYDKLKLVTHCKAKETNATAVLKEFWIYKMFNEVTNNSFKVHLLEIVYIDENDADRTIKSHAFIIENNKEMAHRIGGELVEGIGIQTTALIPNSYHNILMFNYMIGNTDWDLKHQKNIKLVKRKDQELYIIVPYDFDFAKLVSPSYLRIEPALLKIDINNRIIKDKFSDKAELKACIAQFQALRRTGFTCYNKCKELTAYEKMEMTNFIKSFFKKTKKKEQFMTMFLAKN